MSNYVSFIEVIQTTALSETVKGALKLIGKRILKSISWNTSTRNDVEQQKKFEAAIASLLIEIYNWSKGIEFIGLGEPIETSTVGLKYYFSLRDDNPKIQANKQDISESDLIVLPGNFLIEGHPGTGKTTTLKRLLHNSFFGTKRVKTYHYPLLVRLRLIKPNFNLFTHICYLLGISVQKKVVESVRRVKKIRRTPRLPNTKEEVDPHPSFYHKWDIEEYYEDERTGIEFDVVDDKPVDRYVIDLLENNSVLVFIDGLDELNPKILEECKDNIKQLSMGFSKAKVIITSRPDYLQVNVDNCTKIRIKDLSDEQQVAIAKCWLPDSDVFMSALSQKSYSEFASKPLFLAFLILLYRENTLLGIPSLPDRSIDVYTQIVELLIERWDLERDIKTRQHSQYSNFNNKKKEKFLSELAFILTYRTKQKIFTTDQLLEAYGQMYENYGLPIEEAVLVVKEIQTHTGLIMKSAYLKYEFSHLAIQEFLCANYILSAPLDENILIYLREYPAPLALCVALSLDSSAWLESLLARLRTLPSNMRAEIATKLLSRLISEAPHFKSNNKLAVSLLELTMHLDFRVPEISFVYETFIKSNKNIETQIIQLLHNYILDDRKLNFSGKVILKLKPVPVALPETVYLPKDSYLKHCTSLN
jgi:GTPase SAR1 family protein